MRAFRACKQKESAGAGRVFTHTTADCVDSVVHFFDTDVYCEWVSCPHSPSIFWNSFQETEITTISQMMQAAMSSNCEVGRCEVEDEDEDAADGFHRGSL